MPSPLENELLLYYMSGIGGTLGGPGSVAEKVGGMTQQQIQSQNFMKLMKTLLSGGGKFAMDKEGMNLKAPVGAFRDTELSIPGFEDSYPIKGAEEAYSGVSGVKTDYPTYSFSPSASPLDVSGADLAGLTPENISQALQLKFTKEEIGRKTTADLVRAGYYGAATKKMAAETAAIPTKQFIAAWKVASKDERSAALKLYDRYVEQEKGAGRTPKSLEEWVLQVAEASGKSTERILAEFVAKKEAGTELELAGPDFARDVRAGLEKDRQRWTFPPKTSVLPGYEGLVAKGLDEPEALDLSQKMMVLDEMESRIKSFYKGKEVERRNDGWYIGGKLKVRNPYYGGR